MADPYEEPEGETPAERRERLLNLTNPDWSPPSAGGGVVSPTKKYVVGEDGPETVVKQKGRGQNAS